MTKFAFASIHDLQEALRTRTISRQELLQFFLDRAHAHDGTLGSGLEWFDAESILAASSSEGPLAGIPGLIKDNICQKNRITSCASKILADFKSTYDATAVQRLKKAGAPLVGRANMDEFAMGSSNETSAYKTAHNPWNTERVPGGSSGGSAAAVAAGLVPWALGSETGGSVRQPAAFCGVVGFKPTYGLISRYGLVAYASSLDQIGIVTRSAHDCAQVLSVIAGHDERDATSLTSTKKDYVAVTQQPLKSGMTIGIIENALQAKGVDKEVHAAVELAIAQFETMGITIKRITLPLMDYSAAVYFILSRAEAASNLSRFDGVRYGVRDMQAANLVDMYTHSRYHGFGQEVKARILVGNYVLSASHASEYYQNAQKVQRMLRQEFVDAFKEVDFLIAPTHPAPAFKIYAFSDDKLQMDLQDYFTCAINIVGIPAISLPCGLSSDNMPIGFQLIGPHESEDRLLQLSHAYQQVTEWHTKHPVDFI